MRASSARNRPGPNPWQVTVAADALPTEPYWLRHASHRPRVHLDRRSDGAADGSVRAAGHRRARPADHRQRGHHGRPARRLPLRRFCPRRDPPRPRDRAGGDHRLRRDAGHRADRRRGGAAARGPRPRAQRDAAVRARRRARAPAAGVAGGAGRRASHLHVARRRGVGAVHRHAAGQRRAGRLHAQRPGHDWRPHLRHVDADDRLSAHPEAPPLRAGADDGARARSRGGAGEGRLRHGRRRSRPGSDPPARARRHAAHRRRPRVGRSGALRYDRRRRARVREPASVRRRQRPAAAVRARRRHADRAVPADRLHGPQPVAVPGRRQRARHRRARAGDDPRAAAPGVHHAESHHRRRLGRLGPGARSVRVGDLRSAVHAAARDRRSGRAAPARRRALRPHRQGPLRLHVVRLVPPAAGRRPRCLSAVREPAQPRPKASARQARRNRARIACRRSSPRRQAKRGSTPTASSQPSPAAQARSNWANAAS